MLLEAVGAKLNIISTDGLIHSCTAKEYLALNMQQKVILSVVFPQLSAKHFEFRSYKIMSRAQNAHAMVNAAFLFRFESIETKKVIKSCQICYGGINPRFIHAEYTEKLLESLGDIYTNENLEKAIKSLQSEIEPDSVLPDSSAEYRKNLAVALFYRFVLSTSPIDEIKNEYRSGSSGFVRPLSSGTHVFVVVHPNVNNIPISLSLSLPLVFEKGIQTYETDDKSYPLTQPTLKYEGLIQCAGEVINDSFKNNFIIHFFFKL